MNKQELKEKLKYSFCPYSKVQVAACAIYENGKEFYGVNCENPAFPSGLCAERSALFGSVVTGIEIGKFKEIHIISNSNRILYPCAACLQVITQFLKRDGKIFIYSNDLKLEESHTIKEFVPFQVREDDIKF
ncbi:cytidine deaminase [Metamycoplasma subdolum]|uniref:Cytidine deaminase n=1 Tax=Metamycoplasma subdolum TaxID=92407 RepID=A0A3M0A1J5_9BACT|nr:cytidine deaminase [Metamycoplasma subdolum]RMA78660.1 cytidine deaminase [Metamycoplasma subdolum]WPB50738.1 cytidine deaminase [Metamycoplasma subdolum]